MYLYDTLCILVIILSTCIIAKNFTYYEIYVITKKNYAQCDKTLSVYLFNLVLLCVSHVISKIQNELCISFVQMFLCVTF